MLAATRVLLRQNVSPFASGTNFALIGWLLTRTAICYFFLLIGIPPLGAAMFGHVTGHASASDTLDLVEVGWKMENRLAFRRGLCEPFVELWPAKFTLL